MTQDRETSCAHVFFFIMPYLQTLPSIHHSLYWETKIPRSETPICTVQSPRQYSPPVSNLYRKHICIHKERDIRTDPHYDYL